MAGIETDCIPVCVCCIELLSSVVLTCTDQLGPVGIAFWTGL